MTGVRDSFNRVARPCAAASSIVPTRSPLLPITSTSPGQRHISRIAIVQQTRGSAEERAECSERSCSKQPRRHPEHCADAAVEKRVKEGKEVFCLSRSSTMSNSLGDDVEVTAHGWKGSLSDVRSARWCMCDAIRYTGAYTAVLLCVAPRPCIACEMRTMERRAH